MNTKKIYAISLVGVLLVTLAGYGFTNPPSVIEGPNQKPSKPDKHCVIFLEPVREGEQYSKASEPVCSDEAGGEINSVAGQSLASSFLIAKFWDHTSRSTLLVSYYGSAACGWFQSYSVSYVGASLNNRFESGEVFSNCDRLTVYEYSNFGGALKNCGSYCSSFTALNNEVTSWKAKD